MKYLLLILLIPSISFSQKIVKNEIDKFTKQRVIQTSEVSPRNGMSCKIDIFLKADGKDNFLNISGYQCLAIPVNNLSQLIFLLDNDKTATAYSVGEQKTSFNSSNLYTYYNHTYMIDVNELMLLSSYKLKAIRAYGFGGDYKDIEIQEKEAMNYKIYAPYF